MTTVPPAENGGTYVMNNELRNGWELAIEIGLSEAKSLVEDSDLVCSVHGVNVKYERARVASGWMAANTCPSHDGTCGYDVDAPTFPCEGPALYETPVVQVDVTI